ncbi:YsnF/AvaK domain-containing protein [Brevibacterium sp.]|uniref:YsnF/AvaK domain-containing protein n=1 Tax=Brevibacterium sp. TaxID=1701 RepID=UPI002811DFAD|nr:YsnF/AvaK domain-containing protein [Brevibacterium sp.]
MITKQNIAQILDNGGKVLGPDGDKIGSIGQVYVDDRTGEPSWVTANTGLFGTKESFAPLDGATIDGDDIRIAFDKDTVKDAPSIDPEGHLSEQEQAELYRYYSVSDGGPAGGVAGGQTDRGLGDTDRGAVGHDTSGPTTDEAMTRSEEELHVGKESRETGRARLRKYVVTENETRTVPVEREEVRVEREPITDANRDEALDGPAISEEEHEVTLHEERPVVDKETVPVERVRLDKERVTDEETVSDEVRKERIETDGEGIDPRERRG